MGCCCFSVAQSCSTLRDPTESSTPGFSVLHHLPEFAIQLSHPLLLPFFCLQSFPASSSFPMSWLFTSGGQSIGASASALVLPMNIQFWFPLGLTGLISMLSKGTLKNLLQHHNSKVSIFWCSDFLMVQLSLWLYGPLSATWCLCFLICCLGFS